MDKLVFSCFLLGGLTPAPPGSTDTCALNAYCAEGLTNVGCNPAGHNAQAGHNAHSCVVKRDDCRNTADFSNVGQMIIDYSIDTSDSEPLSVTGKLNEMLFYRVNSNTYFNSAQYSSYSASTDPKGMANIANDRSTKVGCALMEWTEGTYLILYLVCNFSANVIEGQPLYTSAAISAEGCGARDMSYLYLCVN